MSPHHHAGIICGSQLSSYIIRGSPILPDIYPHPPDFICGFCNINVNITVAVVNTRWCCDHEAMVDPMWLWLSTITWLSVGITLQFLSNVHGEPQMIPGDGVLSLAMMHIDFSLLQYQKSPVTAPCFHVYHICLPTITRYLLWLPHLSGIICHSDFSPLP